MREIVKKKEKCITCQGQGRRLNVDIMKGQSSREVCPSCQGRGEKEIVVSGPRIGVIYAPTLFFQMIENEEICATLECRQRPVLNEMGQPLAKVNKTALFKRDKERPRLYLEIARMNTKPEYRKQGIMTELLCMAAGNKDIEWMETLWDDSTEDGRAFLLSHGFIKEGNRIVWEKTDERQFPSGSNSDGDGDKLEISTDNILKFNRGAGRSVSDADPQREEDSGNVTEGPASA